MDIKRIREKAKPFEATWEGEAIRGTFRPAALTGGLMARAAGADGADVAEVNAGVLAEVIADWDVTCDGEPYPPTPENLMALPVQLVTAVFNGVVEANRPSTSSSSA